VYDLILRTASHCHSLRGVVLLCIVLIDHTLCPCALYATVLVLVCHCSAGSCTDRPSCSDDRYGVLVRCSYICSLMSSSVVMMDTWLVTADYTAPEISTQRPAPNHYSIPTPTLCSFLGIDSDSASSLPSLVLRSMLKQRRILMRMH